MGRRSRARRAAGIAPASPTPRAGGDDLPPRPAPLSDERPKAPWHPFPLVELCVLVGIVLIVLGLIVGFDSDRGQLALVCGVLLASLGGLDTAVREHFNGYKSHSSVLAGPARGLRRRRAVLRPRALDRRGGGRRARLRARLLGLPHRVPPPLGRIVVPLK